MPSAATMRAARFHAESGSLELRDVPVPEPGPGEVLVKVEACGICLSDVHLIDGTLPGPLAEVTPGHEATGVIDTLGSAVRGWQVGDPVVLAAGRPCQECESCVSGRFEDCVQFEIMGFSFDGAWAEYVVVPSFALTRRPDGMDIHQAAICADAVSTPYAGIVRRAELRPGESVGLWGIGGLGVHAVQVARLAGAGLVIAIDPNETARERAAVAGADVALDPTSVDIPAEMRRLTNDRGLDLAVDLVGANAVLAQAAECLGRHGRVLMVGLSLDPIQLGIGVFFGLLSQSLLGHLGYTKKDLDDVVSLAATGRLDLSRSVSRVIDLEDVVAGVDALRHKDGNPVRIVVVPGLS
jgi:D-arabinose 1-dehydrogenase-like Zn-dependent alcohol dehydrogenase